MSNTDAHRQPPATIGAMVRYSMVDFGISAHPLRSVFVERVAYALDGMGLGDAVDYAIVRGTETDRENVVRRCRRGLLVLGESTRWDVDRERLVVALEIAVRACESREVAP
jgi:hypothetical protein